VLKDEVEKIRNSIAFWSATRKRNEKFEDTARQLRIACTRKLAIDCQQDGIAHIRCLILP
jgi:hypothetical protein